MPAITIKVAERELTWGQAVELIEDVTNAVVPFAERFQASCIPFN